MKNNLLISVIVPVYNAEQFLHRCVNSILNQSFTHLELILVDDGSKDHSGEICDVFAQQDNRVTVVHQSNSGVSSARNRGLELAQGDYLLFVDSDDALAIDVFERLIEIEKEKNCDCIIFGIQQDSGSFWAADKEVDYVSNAAFLKDFPYWLNTELLSPPFNKFLKHSLIKHKFLEHLSFGEDLVFNLTYLKECERISIIKTPFYLYNNLNESSITHNFKINRIVDIEAWQKAVLEFSIDCTNPALYRKYQLDVLYYMKRLYGSSELSYRDMKEMLEQWYPQSHLSKWNGNFNGSMVDNFLYVCLRNQCWILPYLCLSFKRKCQRLYHSIYCNIMKS